jgi:hypothetical protein
MKNIFLPILVITCSLSTHAQYYYKDIIGTQEMNQLIKGYTNNKVLAVTATGFDDAGTRNNDFSEIHDFNIARGLLKISTQNQTDITNQYYRFDKNGFLTSVSDTSSSIISITSYSYDDKNNLVAIKNMASDGSDSIFINEVHQWFYNTEGRPVRMLRVVNNTDTTDVRFTLDQHGNVVEELPFIKKVSREKTYYYYDDNNRLTDIVRFNVKARRLLPDYMFEYSPANQVIQKITTLSTKGLGYLIWRYVYNDNGLKTKEASFNRDKVMTGKIEYSYRVGQ